MVNGLCLLLPALYIKSILEIFIEYKNINTPHKTNTYLQSLELVISFNDCIFINI